MAKPTVQELEAIITDLECTLVYLEERLAKPGVVTGRKEQVLGVLKSAGHITVAAIATRIGISARNVSSQLTYLRKDGYGIATDSLGRKFLE